MHSRRTISLAALGILAAPRLMAGEGAPAGAKAFGVLELFTSQGCSSCPPADAVMLELAQSSQDIIPLTFPVEVWDYLGWKDTLARPAFTARQKAYANTVGDRRVFTPQAVANGRVSWVGSDLAAIDKWRARGTNTSGSRLAVTPTPEGWQVVPQLVAGSMARLLVLPLATRRMVKVDRGENNGRTITYANVVRDIRDAGPLENGRAVPLTRSQVEAPEADGFALLAQMGTLDAPGVILAAALVDQASIKA